MATPSPLALRTQFFQKLKVICVPINRLAVLGFDKASEQKELRSLLAQLLELWQGQAEENAHVLDDKLADYVFVPLSHILRRQRESPSIVVEATLGVLTRLVQYGWKSKISKELSGQLLLLFTYIIDGVPGEKQDEGRRVSEELVLEGYRALAVLIAATGSSASNFLEAADNVPSVGHAASVILDGVKDGATPEIQLEAVRALEALRTAVKDRTMLATFLPGTVSALSRALAPPVSLKRQKRFLVTCLDVLRLTLVTLLGDIRVRHLLNNKDNDKDEDKDKTMRETKDKESNATANGENGKVLTSAWLQATAGQVKIALATVLKLRNHDAAEVRQALHGLCIALLDECHQSLRASESMLVETAMLVAPDGAETETLRDTSLVDLAMIYPELSDTVKTVMFHWVTSMPTAMQSADERVKQHSLRTIGKGGRMVSNLQLDSATLDDALALSLKDSTMVLMLGAAKTPKVLLADPEADDENSWQNRALVPSSGRETFTPVLLEQEGSRAVREELDALLANIGSPDRRWKLASQMMGYVRDTEGVDQVASYWLALQLVRSATVSNADVDALLDFAANDNSTETQLEDSVFHELYDFSVSVIAAHSDAAEVGVDWRLEAIAMEATAFAAARMQADFRPELIDVLYPVATFLGSAQPRLRSHAITTLNAVAAACGYGSVSDLVVDNVDYMVNSVALRLNTLDVSPASTSVLAMMVRLTGPRLLPFLDDVVAAIFAALDNYHGYPAFVESLFAVLKEVVEQGVKLDRRLLVAGGAEGTGEIRVVQHMKTAARDTSIVDIADMLDRRREAAKRCMDERGQDSHPQRPWNKELDADADNEQPSEPDNSEPAEEVAEPPKPAPTPTYSLLHKVAHLTQHYLTSPTPTLRKSLLDLAGTVAPALAPDEDAFLPLVNDLWPVVVARLRDDEPFVVVAACKAIAVLCAAAGDFLATRVKTAWWEGDGWGRWCRGVKKAAVGNGTTGGRRVAAAGGARTRAGVKTPLLLGPRAGETHVLHHNDNDNSILIPIRDSAGDMAGQLVPATTPAGGGGGLGRFAQTAQVWAAVQDLLVAVVAHVRLDDDTFDQILDLLADGLGENAAARTALELVNADAVWLARYERGQVVGPGETPVMDGVVFVPVEG